MKKIYSLLLMTGAVVAMAQGVENFDTANLTSNYEDGSFIGVNGIEWSYTHSRNEGLDTEDDYSIDGKGLMLRKPLTSSFSGTITGGVGTLSFEYRKAFTGGSERQLELYVNDVVVSTSEVFGEGSGEQTDVYTLTAEINTAEAITIKIKNVGDLDQNRQSTIDNITWTGYGLSVDDLDSNKIKMTTVWNKEATFSIKGNAIVEIYNLNGQLVLKEKGNNTFNVNVSNLNKGIYLVKILNQGNIITQKVIKK